MTGTQFLNAVALGQITPSFVFVLAGAGYFSVLRTSRVAPAFLDGAGPAATGLLIVLAGVPPAH